MDEVLRLPGVVGLIEAGQPRWAVVAAVREEIARVRGVVRGGAGAGTENRRQATGDRQQGTGDTSTSTEVEVGRIAAGVAARLRPGLCRVINATGVVLHTNLGRAPLAQAALDRIVAIGSGYSNLEYDLAAGERGARERHVQALAELVGAEAALVVNNCAGAVLLALTALAAGRDVVVSRGELIEIGGGFRIPDVMAASGARLVEVGTTNKTRALDYEVALRPETALLMKVHRSNFAIVGFTTEASVAELAALGAPRQVPVLVDLGSGAMAEIHGEPTAATTLAAGADLVAISGDKLLGGPQAGILLGRRGLVTRCARHPLYRALRPSKLELAALEATTELWRDGREAEIPTWAMLTASPDVVRARAEAVVAAAGGGLDIVAVVSKLGGGTLPLAELPSFAIALPEQAEPALRAGSPPVIGRIEGGRLLLDLRTVADSEVALLARAVAGHASAETST